MMPSGIISETHWW